MKTLTNHTLVYDSECPMCDLYTRGFIKTGMLDCNGRVKYGNARVPVAFNNTRARNEIALIDYDNGTVTYGLDSLIKVVSHSFPLLGKILKFSVVRAPLNVLYSFISYNRKVIAPPKVFEKRGACTPAFKVGYRIAYIVLACLISALIFGKMFLIFGGVIGIQTLIVSIVSRNKTIHYLGNMMTVLLIGALLSLVVSIYPVIAFMLFLNWRRANYLFK